MTSQDTTQTTAVVRTSTVNSSMFEPRELDILVGKETRARNHKGSRCFRLFVESYRRRYQDAKNKHKRASITREMYDTITQASIRFLKFNDERKGWEEITSTEARDKITHALRFAQKKRRRKTPQRQGSDSTHRSETSTTSATSLDLDQLLLQQQQHLTSPAAALTSSAALTSLSHMNASLRACRNRSSFSSVGSASLLSNGSKDSKSSKKSNPRVSFSVVTESTIYSADLSASATTAETASVDPCVPLPVDLSSTQHFDMHTSQASLGGDELVDKPPRMPSRPTEEEEEELQLQQQHHHQQQQSTHQQDNWGEDDVLKSAGIDTLMNSSANGFDLLDPLMEIDHERGPDSSSNSSKETQLDEDDDDDEEIPTTSELPNMELLDGIDDDLANMHLASTQQEEAATTATFGSNFGTAQAPLFVGPTNLFGGPTSVNPVGYASGNPFPGVGLCASSQGSAGAQQQPQAMEGAPNGTGEDYSLKLMQEPLLEWWKPDGTS
ncbi:expressed unknown protein [Seminavis robusta]|uniref:DUF6824 domain-containing protein n=1 Tax=Seminavis robusta TaxID=568900 RepID=A0A9N8H3A7_9STRA|nr:expressed unknown protein [Seminavis robusta]|eukprot:Sro23_g015640.1 n/a (497) ;mRNA; f:37998-39488